MSKMFNESPFNGDISQWDVSNVKNMKQMFCYSKFNGDISKWDVSNVKDMDSMFTNAKFNKNISNWKPFLLKTVENIFFNYKGSKPYWAIIDDPKKRKNAIDNYQLSIELESKLNNRGSSGKKLKI